MNPLENSTLVEREDAAESEGAGRATELSAGGAAARPGLGSPDPEVPTKAKRRRFSAEYKQRIVAEADRCQSPGDVGALLRREGLYSSLLTDWRRQCRRGALAGLTDNKRGRKKKPRADPRVKQLERENARLDRRLEKAETIIEFQKKLADILGITLKSPPGEGDE